MSVKNTKFAASIFVMAKPKYYTVWKGREAGVFNTWEACRKQVDGFDGALYKSFETRQEAETALTRKPFSYFKRKGKPEPVKMPAMEPSLSVDAACSGNPGVMEYRGVWTHNREQVFHKGPFPQATNNIGEFLAIVHALALLKKNNSNLPIYTDSLTALKWVRTRIVKTKLQPTVENEPLFDLIERAVNWLNANTYSNEIRKWDTKSWGEIPADFGRK